MESFFEHQDRAQSRSGWLVILFIMGTLGITACVTLIFAVAIPDSIPVAVGVSLAMVGIPFAYKLATVSGSGQSVALAMGGVRIDPATDHPAQRKILNVVEEMAIASGMPIPPVYLMDEPGINAFAAGTGPQNAVIGISVGAIESLTRDELQGVMAHEFSHIFHGDMRINMRAIAAIFGLMAIGYVGYFIVRSQSYSRFSSSRNKNGGGIYLVGLALILVGAIGTFFGRLMQAAISRQREFLADASAVQYTRNPDGIGGALQKIAMQSGGLLGHPSASQFNHMFFTEGVRSMFASHPPLQERIKRIKAMAGGVLRETSAPPPVAVGVGGAERGRSVDLAASLVGAGSVSPQALDEVHAISGGAAGSLLDLAHTVEGSVALVLRLSLSQSADRARLQLDLVAREDPTASKSVAAMLRSGDELSVMERLAILDVACASLVRADPNRYRSFRATLGNLLRVDGSIDLFEWVVVQVLRMRVEEPMALAGARKLPPRRMQLDQLVQPCQRILAILALQGSNDADSARAAFQSGLQSAGLPDAELPPESERTLDALASDLDRIEALRPAAAGVLLSAAVDCVSHDRNTTETEYLLLRALSERLQVPLPLQYG